MRRHIVSLLSLSILSLLAACSVTDTDTVDADLAGTVALGREALTGDGQGADDPGQGAFYPLETGNTWTYEGSYSMSVGGSGPYQASVRETRTLTGTEELYGREYVLEEQVSVTSGMITPDDTSTQWLRYRQDRAGLYEADVSVTDPPGETAADQGPGRWEVLWRRAARDLMPLDREAVAAARTAHFEKIEAVSALFRHRSGPGPLTGHPGGVLPDEIQRLRYPLHPKQEWVIRDVPLFYSVVEKHEVLDLPAGRMNGWRIRVYNEFLGENDLVYLWYGRAGFLGMTAHLETETVGFDGSIITAVSDEELFLESYDLERTGGGADPEEDGKKAAPAGDGLTAR